MSNIDRSRLITAQQRSAEHAHERAQAIKRECTLRIEQVLDAKTVSNVQGALLLDQLTGKDRKVFASGHKWVQDTVEACRALIVDPDADWQDDAAWPPLPDGVADLAERF